MTPLSNMWETRSWQKWIKTSPNELILHDICVFWGCWPLDLSLTCRKIFSQAWTSRKMRVTWKMPAILQPQGMTMRTQMERWVGHHENRELPGWLMLTLCFSIPIIFYLHLINKPSFRLKEPLDVRGQAFFEVNCEMVNSLIQKTRTPAITDWNVDGSRAVGQSCCKSVSFCSNKTKEWDGMSKWPSVNGLVTDLQLLDHGIPTPTWKEWGLCAKVGGFPKPHLLWRARRWECEVFELQTYSLLPWLFSNWFKQYQPVQYHITGWALNWNSHLHRVAYRFFPSPFQHLATNFMPWLAPCWGANFFAKKFMFTSRWGFGAVCGVLVPPTLNFWAGWGLCRSCGISWWIRSMMQCSPCWQPKWIPSAEKHSKWLPQLVLLNDFCWKKFCMFIFTVPFFLDIAVQPKPDSRTLFEVGSRATSTVEPQFQQSD